MRKYTKIGKPLELVMRSESNLPSRTDNPQSNNNKQEEPSDSNYARIKAQDKIRTEHIELGLKVYKER
jgi:hypothetical protein